MWRTITKGECLPLPVASLIATPTDKLQTQYVTSITNACKLTKPGLYVFIRIFLFTILETNTNTGLEC